MFLIDWEALFVRGKDNTPLIYSTMRNVSLEYDQYQFSQRTGVEYPMNIDWEAIFESLGNQAKTKDGGYHKGNILEAIKGNLESYINNQKMMPDALHAVFNEFGGNELEIHTAIAYALQKLNIKIKDAEQTRQNIKDYIKGSMHFKFIGVASGTLYRILNEKNEPTKVELPEEPEQTDEKKNVKRYSKWFNALGIGKRDWDDLQFFMKKNYQWVEGSNVKKVWVEAFIKHQEENGER
jgi:hypothetical protein